MRFVAIDVETANADLSSICQIGVVSFCDRGVVQKWERLVNPEDHFDPVNVSVHGISDEAVAQAPTLPQLFEELQKVLSDQVVVHHTGFDRASLTRATEKHGLPRISCTWLDSAKVVRRAWPEYSSKGYGLANITQRLGIEFRHHDAAEDARAAGEVLLRAMGETGRTLDDWLVRVRQPISGETRRRGGSRSRAPIAREGNPDGPLAGEVAVFTGALSIPRREAAQLAANAGCTVEDSVKKATTLLVVGDQDVRKLGGHEKSSKHRKAEELIAKGQPVRILAEGDFRRLLEIEGVGT